MKCNRVFALSFALVLVVAFSSVSAAPQISLNFSENPNNQVFDGGQLIGPLSTDSTNWNSTNGVADLAAGTVTDLIDNSGANTGASVTWTSSNVWWNADGTDDDEHKLAVGYLDDGDPDADGFGISITFSDVPYDRYRVYGLLASDQGVEYDTRDFAVNGASVLGAATAPAFGTIEESLLQTSQFWSLADGTARGNYWTADTGGSTLTITAPPRNGPERASITGVIIEEIPEPASLGLLCLVAAMILAYTVRRRK